MASLVPTARPLHALADALLPLLEPGLADEVARLAKVAELANLLAGGTVGVGDVVARALAKQPGTDRLLLVVDQWEELYTLCRDDVARVVAAVVGRDDLSGRTIQFNNGLVPIDEALDALAGGQPQGG